jgi:hypothetical protein
VSREVAEGQVLCHRTTIRGNRMNHQASHSTPRQPWAWREFTNNSKAVVRLQSVK